MIEYFWLWNITIFLARGLVWPHWSSLLHDLKHYFVQFLAQDIRYYRLTRFHRNGTLNRHYYFSMSIRFWTVFRYFVFIQPLCRAIAFLKKNQFLITHNNEKVCLYIATAVIICENPPKLIRSVRKWPPKYINSIWSGQIKIEHFG